MVSSAAHVHGVVPPFLLERMASARAQRSARVSTAAASARRTLEIDREIKTRRTGTGTGKQHSTAALPQSGSLKRTIYDAKSKETLPGKLVRAEGAPATKDAATDESYDGLGDTYAFFENVYGRSSLDDHGLPLDATVHYGEKYDNAFWDGSRMVFGDGDGEVFARFTISVSVIGHELAHGFTQYTSQLAYEGQPGALNESISDVFGVMVEQYVKKQTVATASWLVGEGLFLPAVQGKALRSMLAPGSAYDDDMLGKDPQPADMDGYDTTTDDNGGVHINSGIPNRAFAVAATTLGGSSWERAGQVWFDTVTSGSLSPTVDFADFAAATVLAAGVRYGVGSDVQTAVSNGWSTVKVKPTPPASTRV